MYYVYNENRKRRRLTLAKMQTMIKVLRLPNFIIDEHVILSYSQLFRMTQLYSFFFPSFILLK